MLLAVFRGFQPHLAAVCSLSASATSHTMLVVLQAVLDHPFTQACPLVQQCLQEDLQRLQDHHSGLCPSGDGGFRCQQRRVVLPACTAGAQACSTCAADAALPAGQGSLQAHASHGRSSSREATATTTACASTAAPDLSLQQQAGSGSGLTRGASGWLSRSGSSGSAKPGGSSWRSYRRRLTPSCRELMYVCDGDRNGVIHYIATGEAPGLKLQQMLQLVLLFGTADARVVVVIEMEVPATCSARWMTHSGRPTLTCCCVGAVWLCTEYGSKPWVNPVLSKALEIKASSPASRYTDPKVCRPAQA